MHPAAFDYYAPDTLEQAVELIGEHGDEAKVLAGGQSLIPLLKLRFASPADAAAERLLPLVGAPGAGPRVGHTHLGHDLRRLERGRERSALNEVGLAE